jgi:alpha-galactosidase
MKFNGLTSGQKISQWTSRILVGSLMFCASLFAQGTNDPSGNILAATPPMGWNSWNTFGDNINETVIRGVADTIVASGLKGFGYEYVVIDDHWEGGRDTAGNILANREKFSHGIKALADYIHSKGLKFGIYSCAGDQTCGGEVGSYGYEESDAATWAQWGVDYLKYDYCYAPIDLDEAMKRYTRMGNAIKATGRPMIYSLCEWGDRAPWLWGRKAGGQLWRVSHDVSDAWDNPRNVPDTLIGILAAVDASANLERFAGPGGWNDPDMLVVGLNNHGNNVGGGGCTTCEYQTQMSMWCILAAPLMIGCDVRNMDAEARRILTNPEAIAVDQDTLGKQGGRVARTGSTEVWRKPLANDEMAVAMLNRGETETSITANWQTLGFSPSAAVKVRDLWQHKNLGVFTGSYTVTVAPHATVLIRLVKDKGIAAK